MHFLLCLTSQAWVPFDDVVDKTVWRPAIVVGSCSSDGDLRRSTSRRSRPNPHPPFTVHSGDSNSFQLIWCETGWHSLPRPAPSSDLLALDAQRGLGALRYWQVTAHTLTRVGSLMINMHWDYLIFQTYYFDFI